MLLKKIALSHFRNFKSNTIYFHPFLTVVLGKNSVGKTNLLESAHLICTGKGLTDQKQDELITFEKKSMSVAADFSDGDDTTQFAVFMRKKGESVEKTFHANRVKKNFNEYYSLTQPAVIFTPSQIQIIDGRPGRRRKFIDDLLTRTDLQYKKNITEYEAGLKRRNKVLEVEKDLRTLRDELHFWDTYLIQRASYVQRARDSLVKAVNKGKQLDEHIFKVYYMKNEMSKKTLEETFDKQRVLKTTIVGPQRDDIRIEKDGINVHTYGSRSEQRMALFWLILQELSLYVDHLKSRPLLLLDDIFSELDPEHKDLVLKLIAHYQTILTTTEADLVQALHMPHSLVKL